MTNAIKRNPPGPRGLPILGNFHRLHREGILDFYTKLWREYGDIVQVKTGPLTACLITQPDYYHHVLVKNRNNYMKGLGYEGLRLMLGQGLITSEEDIWRPQRRLMQPFFTPAAINQFTKMMTDATQTLLERWEPFAKNESEIHVNIEMMRLTMTIIGLAMFSVDLSKGNLEVGQAIEDCFVFIAIHASRPLSVPLFVPIKRNRDFKKSLKIIHTFIDERIDYGKRHPNSDDILSTLLHAQDEETKQGMSMQQLRDEVITLFFAGFETTARTLTWAWYLLSQHPEVADKLYNESKTVLDGCPPTVEDLYNLPYTRMVVDETLRLYPATAFLARQNIEADEIGGYHIQPKSLIALSPFITHRHPDIWENPHAFDPERFTPDKVKARHKYAYIPFGGGPRICIGNSFALLEAVIALAMIVPHYRLDFPMGQVIEPTFKGTTHPKEEIFMRVGRR